MAEEDDEPFPRVPVLVVTGFLGSGKTTLLNRILVEGSKRIAVIENVRRISFLSFLCCQLLCCQLFCA